MSKIVQAECHVSKRKWVGSWGKAIYASGWTRSFDMKYAPKSFNAFCMKCEPVLARSEEYFDVWEYTRSGKSKGVVE